MNIRVVSIEPSRRCSKACAFCYNGSSADGDGEWTAEELIAFGEDLAEHGVESLSLGGGEPLEWPGVFEVLDGLRTTLLRSLTTNGLPLRDADVFDALVRAAPEKVHVSIHQPSSRAEVLRALRLAERLRRAGVRSGINLLVARSKLSAAAKAGRFLRSTGVSNERIVYLPCRGSDTPTPDEVAQVAGGPFQSMSCLSGCGVSPRFASIGADRTAAWCSYTRTRRRLAAPTWRALTEALDGLGLASCDEEQLVRLDVRRRDAGGATGARERPAP